MGFQKCVCAVIQEIFHDIDEKETHSGYEILY